VTVPVTADHPQAGSPCASRLVNRGAAQANFDDVRPVAFTTSGSTAGPLMSNVNASLFAAPARSS
jgi:hypothetical protein